MPDALDAAQKRLAAARARARRKALGPPLAVDQAADDAQTSPAALAASLAEAEALVRDSAGQFGVDLLRARRA